MLLGLILGALGCGKTEPARGEQAKSQAESEQSVPATPAASAAKKVSPPVPGGARLACANVIDAAKFTRALGEAAPVSVVDSRQEPDAAASCSLIRGGRRPSEREQLAIKKRNGRVGVIPGDELLNISTFCWTIEEPDRFAAKCLEKKGTLDNALGFQACIFDNPTGQNDVHRYKFFDSDTKCILQVRAGPGLIDNRFIAKSAKAAYDLIGPEEIRPR